MLQTMLLAENGNLPVSLLVGIIVIVVLIFSLLLVFLSRYRRCPSDKVMVIYGRVGQNNDGTSRSAKCIHVAAARQGNRWLLAGPRLVCPTGG